MLRQIMNKLKRKKEQKVQVEIADITSRPLEGEIVRLENIKIKKDFSEPKERKMKERRNYFNKYGYFKSPIILDKNNTLLDGYTTYLLAKEIGYKSITILRNK